MLLVTKNKLYGPIAKWPFYTSDINENINTMYHEKLRT